MDPELLRRAANQRLYEYIKDKVPTDVEVDSDIKKEMDKQKQYQQNSVATLTKKFETSKAIHKEDNNNTMLENMELIKQITALRAEVKYLNEQFMSQGGKKAMELREEEEKKFQVAEAEREKEQRIRQHQALFTSEEEDQMQEHNQMQENNQNEEGYDDMSDGDDAQLNHVDGYDNDLDRNIAVKKRYIGQLKQQLMSAQKEHQELL